MATTWSPKTTLEPKSWLLANGEVVQEPPLEETPSGRKVRVAGTTNSVYISDLDHLLRRAVQTIADAKQTSVWMPLHGLKQAEVSALGYKPAELKAKLHVIHDPDARYANTKVWWRFKHQDLPIEVILEVGVSAQYTYNGTKPQTLAARLVMPKLTLNGDVDASVYSEYSPDFNFLAESGVLGYDERTQLREFVRDNPPNWDASILGQEHYPNERVMVEALLKKVRVADALASIQVPDLRDQYNPAWLDLDLYETNCNDAFVAELADYLDGVPAVEQALEAYKLMLSHLRSAGIVLEKKEDNDFLAALVSGDKAQLSVKMQYPAEEGHGIDNQHTVSLHLPTGTFIVECQVRNASQDEVAEKWEEALTIAQFTGKEDELLAYAREYARTKDDNRTKKILKERKNGATA